MARVEHAIEVQCPLPMVYNQWTQFEEFPRFMEGVEEVRQLDDRHLRWRASVGGRTKEWDAEIQEQIPDAKIIWASVDGDENAGIVQFEPIGPTSTKIVLAMSYLPEGFVEGAGDALGFVDRRVKGDLERFKEFIEARSSETGAWRGTLSNPDAPGGHTRGVPR